MFQLDNFNWEYGTRTRLFKGQIDAGAYGDPIDPSHIISKIVSQGPEMAYTYWECVCWFDPVSVRTNIVIETVIDMPMPTDNTNKNVDGVHPLLMALFPLGDAFECTMELYTEYPSASSAYESLVKKGNTGIIHFKHYPLRGPGRIKTLLRHKELGIKRKEFVQDEPFNILDYRELGNFFGISGGGGHGDTSCNYVMGSSGTLPTGTFRTIS